MASDVSDEFENYDVFISHRGPDTKTGFVSFLHKRLEDAGMRPFLDCKSLDIGEDAWKCINHAIKNTPIGLVIFSENFAQSEWCLRELHAMLGTPSMKVLPIFYKVEPRDVKHPESGPLKAGFEKLKQRHENAIIEQWRSHLEQASKIIGWEHLSRNERMEGDLVTEVVKKVCELANEELPLDVGEYVVGVNEVAEGIIQTLHDKKKVLMLGLWGMGGIGKSTLARELYNRSCKRFGASCFVEDVKEKAALGGVVKVQNQILEDLCRDESEGIRDKSKGKRILEERLSKKQILVVLDDICDNKEMDYCMTRKILIEGSLCIVTSRDRRVFEKLNSFDVNHEIHTHSVQLLNRKASKQVFTSYAFGGGCKVKPGFEELIANVSEACGGLPLVLKVCGALLKNEENVNIWKEVLKKLNHGSIMDEESIFECLKISYDALQRQDQEMFLDIACALLGESVNLAKCLWESHGWHPDLGVRQLVEKALIIVDDKGCFAMHDHLRDMGRRIERKKKSSKRTRLWMPESFELLNADEALSYSLQTLVFSFKDLHLERNADNLLHFDISYLNELRILIWNYKIELISSLPKNLSWFKCYFNILTPIPRRLDWLTRYFNYSTNVLQNYSTNVLLDPNVLQNSKLMILDINCNTLLRLSEPFTHLRNLKVLSLKELIISPDLFGSLKNLRDFNLCRSRIKCLPESFGGLSNLKVLNLSYCEKLIMLPNSFGGLKNLQDFNLCECGIGCLPESFGGLSNLRLLNLSYCYNLFMLPNSFGGLKNLQDFNLCGCGIECLPESFGGLSNLRLLNLSYCDKLIMLPNSFGDLKNLQDLNLCGCEIECLPESFGGLSNLRLLNLWSCRRLIMQPNSFVDFSNLQDLKLSGCGIECLPESFGGLSNLRLLNLRSCEKLIMLPNSFADLKNLQDLKLCGCGIECLPQSFGDLFILRVLDLSFCKKLIMLPNSFGGLSNLRLLNLSSCEKLIMLPNSFADLKNLQDLKLCGCGIECLPQSFGDLFILRVLDLSFCKKLIMLPYSFGNLINLQDLNLNGCGIEFLPESFGGLSNLRLLNLRSCEKLIILPNSFADLKNLQDLKLCGCGIECLPQSFGDLFILRVLDLSFCEKLIMLPNSFGNLISLQNLNFMRSRLRSLPESFGGLSNLRLLNLSYCEKLIMLPNSFGGLKNLQDFNLCGCGIECLPESFGGLSNLRLLNLSYCYNLFMLPNSFGGLKNLEDLNFKRSGLGSLLKSFGGLSNLNVLN